MDLLTAFVTIGMAWVVVMMAIMIGWAIYGLVKAVRIWWGLTEDQKNRQAEDERFSILISRMSNIQVTK